MKILTCVSKHCHAMETLNSDGCLVKLKLVTMPLIVYIIGTIIVSTLKFALQLILSTKNRTLFASNRARRELGLKKMFLH